MAAQAVAGCATANPWVPGQGAEEPEAASSGHWESLALRDLAPSRKDPLHGGELALVGVSRRCWEPSLICDLMGRVSRAAPLREGLSY